MIETEKIYTCKSDRAFKEVFMKEESKDILAKVLETVLKVEIKDIKFLNLERNVDNIHVRKKYFDLFFNPIETSILFLLTSFDTLVGSTNKLSPIYFNLYS